MPIIRIFQEYGKSGETRRKQKSNQQVIKTLERETARNPQKTRTIKSLGPFYYYQYKKGRLYALPFSAIFFLYTHWDF